MRLGDPEGMNHGPLRIFTGNAAWHRVCCVVLVVFKKHRRPLICCEYIDVFGCFWNIFFHTKTKHKIEFEDCWFFSNHGGILTVFGSSFNRTIFGTFPRRIPSWPTPSHRRLVTNSGDVPGRFLFFPRCLKHFLVVATCWNRFVFGWSQLIVFRGIRYPKVTWSTSHPTCSKLVQPQAFSLPLLRDTTGQPSLGKCLGNWSHDFMYRDQFNTENRIACSA